MFVKRLSLTLAFFCLVCLVRSSSALIVVSGTESWGETSMNQNVQIVAGGNLTITGQFGIVNGHTLTVEAGGQVVVNARVDFDSGGTLIMNGGTAEFNDTVKFPDNDAGNVYIYLNGGLLTCGDTESYANRGSELHVGGGVMMTGQITEPRRDPDSSAWNIQPIPPYEDIIITDIGGNVKEISAAMATIEVTFDSAASENPETVSPAILTVNLSIVADHTITVDYQSSAGTATPGVDYTAVNGTLTFIAGDTTEPIAIIVNNDGLDEDDETIIVTLSNPTGANAELGQITQHSYTIIDPRPSLQFASATARGREDVTPAYVTVEMSHSWPESVTVDYTVIGGTATRNTDYILADGMLTFETGQTSRNIPIEIIPDELEDSGETIEIELSNLTGGARFGDNLQNTFTITEEIPLLRGAYYFRADSDSTARVSSDPDVMVRLGDGDNKLIFRRNTGYAPLWLTEEPVECNLPVVITRSNCETTINPYSRVSVIESNPARAIVHWRYARNCSNISETDWVDEYFTVYPDGVCIRTVKNAAGTTFAQWNAATPTISKMILTPDGIDALPASWQNPAVLSAISGDYTYNGFDEEHRCYSLKCDTSSAPTALAFTLDTTGGKSTHDPAIVLQNWGDADANVTVDGESPAICYKGYAGDMYGDDFVIWLNIESTNSVNINITPNGGSGLFADRAPPPDFGYDFDADVPPLPMGSPEPGPFGAYYTNLKFNNRFDELWRVGDHADIVVQFDDNTHRFVFWRGTNYCPHWASDTSETAYSNWYGTQFVERRASEWGYDGCCAEPMQDWDCRYSHARIISSNAARAIVQWRYADCDRNYDIVRDGSGDIWGDWVDEYYTIYPDAISIRKATSYSSRTGGSDMESPHIEFQEAIPITNPGTIPEDNIHWNALSMTDYDRNAVNWLWHDVDGGSPGSFEGSTDKPIMVVRMKGSTVPISIFEGTDIEYDPVGQDNCRPFNQYDDWPAWPDGDRSMGGWLWEEDPDTHCYRYFWTKYPSHCSILHEKWQDYEHIVNQKRTKIMLFGMYNAISASNVNNLITLGRSWQYAPTLTINSPGFSGGVYDKTQRAYKISRDSQQQTKLEFTVNITMDSPLYNPCFVIENWSDNVQISINGDLVQPGPDFRQGIETNSDMVSSLVVWVRRQLGAPVDIIIAKQCGMVADIYADTEINGRDLERIASQWLESAPGCQSLLGDIDKNCKVDFNDFALLAAQWLQSCQ